MLQMQASGRRSRAYRPGRYSTMSSNSVSKCVNFNGMDYRNRAGDRDSSSTTSCTRETAVLPDAPESEEIPEVTDLDEP